MTEMEIAVSLEPVDRARQHNRAPATMRRHLRDTGFHGLPHARQVHVDHVLPVFFA